MAITCYIALDQAKTTLCYYRTPELFLRGRLALDWIGYDYVIQPELFVRVAFAYWEVLDSLYSLSSRRPDVSSFSSEIMWSCHGLSIPVLYWSRSIFVTHYFCSREAYPFRVLSTHSPWREIGHVMAHRVVAMAFIAVPIALLTFLCRVISLQYLCALRGLFFRIELATHCPRHLPGQVPSVPSTLAKTVLGVHNIRVFVLLKFNYHHEGSA
ncbi:hypothetical protein BDN72DRAFT_907030 [Pluteus cervinus]|uniref:Uncharacterized protein n=1 Tax=Pluteus cervinus TaxID=181527 RepID=A0ACD2ZXM3_9AGAR|nr:hypothetical protein BDN72DRAFT_907030 [Pluteus cervinus]